jgi:hypothetical protein
MERTQYQYTIAIHQLLNYAILIFDNFPMKSSASRENSDNRAWWILAQGIQKDPYCSVTLKYCSTLEEIS